MNPSRGGSRPGGAAARGPSPTGSVDSRLDGRDGLLSRARRGDKAAREELIDRYAPFALKVASRVTGGYVRLGEDDESTVALLAFNEAIDRYDPGRGGGFLGFAEEVIRRRLIDHYRRGRAGRREVPLSALSDAGGLDGTLAGEAGGESGPPPAEVLAAEWVHREREDEAERREEVLRYRELLAAYGISLEELVRLSPRHEDARRRAIEAARALAARPELVESLRRRGELPLKELVGLAGLSRKTLERQRKYIIAVALILTEGLPYLEAYLK